MALALLLCLLTLLATAAEAGFQAHSGESAPMHSVILTRAQRRSVLISWGAKEVESGNNVIPTTQCPSFAGNNPSHLRRLLQEGSSQSAGPNTQVCERCWCCLYRAARTRPRAAACRRRPCASTSCCSSPFHGAARALCHHRRTQRTMAPWPAGTKALHEQSEHVAPCPLLSPQIITNLDDTGRPVVCVHVSRPASDTTYGKDALLVEIDEHSRAVCGRYQGHSSPTLTSRSPPVSQCLSGCSCVAC